MTDNANTVDDALMIEPAIPQPQGRANEEDIRLATGFADIFSAITLAGLLTLIGSIGLGNNILGGILAAAAAWFLSIYFVTKRHFAACAIVLTVAFGLSVLAAVMPIQYYFAPFAAGGALWFYWRKFNVPISAALAVVFIAIGPVALYFGVIDTDRLFTAGKPFNAILIFIGFVLFSVALYWDISDRDRTTRRSDIAFWLHLASGPLIVHGIFSMLGLGIAWSNFDAGAQITIWPVFLLVGLFSVIALIIDRRPLIISSFTYLIFAVGIVVSRQFDEGGGSQLGPYIAFMAALMGTGLFIAILAGIWSTLRGRILALLPDSITSKVTPATPWQPPVEIADIADGAGSDAAAIDSEPLRLVHGLNDYMAAIGMGTIFLGSLVAGYLISTFFAPANTQYNPENVQAMQNLYSGYITQVIIGLTIPILAVCGLAAFFVRRRRMALTGVVCALQFALLCVAMAAVVISMYGNIYELQGVKRLDANYFVPILLASVLSMLANLAFWRFNRVAISFALAFAMLFPLMLADYFLSNVEYDGSFGDQAFRLRLIGFGVIAFAVAIAWDRSDRQRKTMRTDNGFWMHMLAALFAIPAIYTIINTLPNAALTGFAFFIALIVLALFLNRRVMLLIALPFIMATSGSVFISIALFAGLTALNLYWEQVRTKLFSLFPSSPSAIKG